MNKPVCIESSNKMELLKEIKENAFFFKLVEMGYDKLIEAHVSYNWMIRPLLLMYKCNVISDEELISRLYIMNVDFGANLDDFVNKELEKQELERKDEFSRMPNHLEYIGYKPYSELIRFGSVGLIGYFYCGYIPYADDKINNNYVNVAYYLTEKDYA